MRVLLIDDDHTPREILKSTILSKYPDATFVECVNGQEGMDTYDSDEGFDLIIIDYIMPEKDGSDVVQYIRKEKGDKTTPLIMCTSKHDRNTVLKLIEAGVSDYLSKPFDTERALAKIDRALKRKKAREERKPKSSLKHAAVGDDIIDDSETQVISLDAKDDDDGEAMELSDEDFQ
ncbi:hypothetical protein MNBD_NITROSPINAE02-865 [hydrothermal vent metagenome]|uniref:Response regulatory domain-containing protein n=1 Tax=hydrothermal vent metagenome TaxID=652676 RepID=A0A3B1C3L9_9ZZZZ